MVLLPTCTPDQCGKDFRNSLRKPSPNYPHGYKTRKPRIVPAFTIQAMQKNTRVIPPPKCGVYDPLPIRPTMFRKCYERGEFPVSIEFTTFGKRLAWKVPIEKLDFHHYLPMFFDGLSEAAYPFTFIVERGIHDLVTKGSYKVLPVVPQIIIPIKNAMATKRPNVLCHALKCIQMIVTGCDRVGEALVPYYRQILPILNLFKDRNHNQIRDPAGERLNVINHSHILIDTRVQQEDIVFNLIDSFGHPSRLIIRGVQGCQHFFEKKNARTDNIGSSIDHTTTRGENVGDLIEDTLQILERYGGPDAFINIKYMIPTYESCVLN